jgi:hypothetical protein
MGQHVFAPQATAQSVESIRTAIVAFAIIAVIFWRTLLKLALGIMAIALVILLISGVILLFQDLHHAVK